MTGTLTMLTRWIGTTNSTREYRLAENYVLLRNTLFANKPDSIGLLKGAAATGVWGVVMETGYPEAVASLVVFADGTVSLYFSNGGGMIGLGSHDGPQRASRALLKMASRFIEYCDLTTKFPLPRREQVRFYLFHQDDTRASEAPEAELAADNHPLSPLFHIAQELITEIRRVDENRHV